jgi:hypothetical protein
MSSQLIGEELSRMIYELLILKQSLQYVGAYPLKL